MNTKLPAHAEKSSIVRARIDSTLGTGVTHGARYSAGRL